MPYYAFLAFTSPLLNRYRYHYRLLCGDSFLSYDTANIFYFFFMNTIPALRRPMYILCRGRLYKHTGEYKKHSEQKFVDHSVVPRVARTHNT